MTRRLTRLDYGTGQPLNDQDPWIFAEPVEEPGEDVPPRELPRPTQLTDWEPPERPDDPGYPSEEELAHIEAWPVGSGARTLIEYVQTLWNYPNFITIYRDLNGWGTPIVVVELVTGGWSGNESIVGALQRAGDGVFWLAYWAESKRGGYFRFEVNAAAWDAEGSR